MTYSISYYPTGDCYEEWAVDWSWTVGKKWGRSECVSQSSRHWEHRGDIDADAEHAILRHFGLEGRVDLKNVECLSPAELARISGNDPKSDGTQREKASEVE